MHYDGRIHQAGSHGWAPGGHSAHPGGTANGVHPPLNAQLRHDKQDHHAPAGPAGSIYARSSASFSPLHAPQVRRSILPCGLPVLMVLAAAKFPISWQDGKV